MLYIDINYYEEDKYGLLGLVLIFVLDLFLNKVGFIKVISLVVRILLLMLEFLR